MNHTPFCLAGWLLALSAVSNAAETRKTLPYADPGNGPELYATYCAVCHGEDFRGRSTEPTGADLTTIAARNGGKFRGATVQERILNRTRKNKMPCWNNSFYSIYWGDANKRQLAVSNLVKLIESHQSK